MAVTMSWLVLAGAGGCAAQMSGPARADAPASALAPDTGAAEAGATEAGAAEADRPAAQIDEPHVVAYEEPPDPLEPVNRAVFSANHALYRYVLVPVSRSYLNNVPEPARNGIGNWFRNVKMPIDLVNHLARLDLGAAGRDLQRFAINTTIGIVGFRDPATDRFGLEAEPTGFRDTLLHYGAGTGVFLVLPFVGPSDAASGIGLVADWMLNPIRFFTDNPATMGVQSVDYLQANAPRADAYPELHAESDDPYAFFRDLHLERVQRDADYP